MSGINDLNFNDQHVLFTPEYSDVLLERIREIYKNDILHSYPQLKLQRLIDLLEHTEYLFELYLKFLYQSNNNKLNTNAQNDALHSFIIGCFYIYLIMPQSIQFQSKNKSYTIYNDIKTLYESQLNMTNVSLMVKNEVETILENNLTISTTYSNNNNNNTNNSISNRFYIDITTNTRKRSYSVPSNQIGSLTNNNTSPYYNGSNIDIENVNDNINKLSIQSDSDDSDDQNPYLWKAPNLEPNDQLKVAAFISSSDLDKDTNDYELKLNKQIDNSILLSPPTYSPPPIPISSKEAITSPNIHMQDSHDVFMKKRNQSLSSFIPPQSTLPSIFNPTYPDNESMSPTVNKDLSLIADRSLTHRKNSYHSVYMLDADETSKNSKFYDESNAFIQSLDRLQKQSIITAPELFSLMSNKNNDHKNFLLIDLRTDSRFQFSHILSHYMVHIDPHLLWDQTTNLPIYEMEKLEAILRSKNVPNLELFERRDQFDYIVYYSDMKTFMKMKFDYHFTFFYLLITSKLRKLKCVPTSLLGGYEKWKKVITNYSKIYDINVSDYLYRSQSSSKITSNSSKSDPLNLKRPHFQPIPENQWKPLEVPIRIRKRPPPPPPSLIPKSPDIVPKIPPRVQIDSSLVSREYPFFPTGQTDNYLSAAPSPSPSPTFSVTSDNAVTTTTTTTTTTTQKQLNKEYYPHGRQSLQGENKLDNIPLISTTLAKHYALHKNRPFVYNDKNTKIDHTNTIQRTYSIPTIEKNPNIYVSLSITGLRNLGNTCYINSMIQCLFATKEFRNLFISSIYKKFLKQNKSNLPQLSNGFYLLFKKMYLNGGCSVVPISFLKICNILRPDLKIPDDQQDTTEFLMLILDKLHDELSNQDEVVNAYPNLMLYDENQLKVETKDYKNWFDKNVIGNGLSPIDDIFQGQIEHSLQCQRCGYSSFNYSTFYVLSLAIPKPSNSTFSKNKRVKLEDCLNMYTSDEILSGENAWECPHCCKITNDYNAMVEKKKLTKQFNKGQSKLSSKNTLSLSSPLSSSSSSSSSSPSSSFRKSGLFRFSRSHDRHHNSNGERDSLKPSYKMGRSLSPFRVLGSNYSNNNNYYTGNKKRDDKESLKMEKIAQREEMKEMKDEMKQWKTKKLITVKTLNFISLPKTLIIHLSRFYYDLTKKNDTIITYPLILEIPTKNGKIVKYKLYGLVNHTGNLISGHYTALVNKELNHSLESNEQKWYYFDDEVVKEETNHGDLKKGITKISSNDVYVLFYERVG